ncbi:MAG TPA: TMEM175 family protein [Rhodanobacteraceae bacterium]|nr:TMEM175 family protein [Rhodanobacteraceae bacterium]
MPPSETTRQLQARQERTESERLDNFVDGAFAFAVTLLVISGSSFPHDIDSLLVAIGGVPAFAACFAQLAVFWYGHVRWREKAQTSDRTSLLLSLLLVFFALIFVYPLHMVFASFFHSISGGALPMDFVFDHSSMHDMKALFVIYGLAYTCMAGTLALLFRHGMRHAVALAPAGRVKAGVHMLAWAYGAAIGLLSAAIALAVPANGSDWMISLAGFSYVLLGGMGPLLGRYRVHLQARLAT